MKHKDIRLLTMDSFSYVTEHYCEWADEEYVRGRILAKVMYGAYVEDRLVGFVGIHEEGSTGLLYVEDTYRGMGIGKSLEAFIINRQKEWGYIPYGQVVVGNEASVQLQESMGLYLSKDTVLWLERQ